MAAEIADAERQLAAATADVDTLQERLEIVLRLLHSCGLLYKHCEPPSRRLLNQAMYERLLIDAEDVTDTEHTPPFAVVRELSQTAPEATQDVSRAYADPNTTRRPGATCGHQKQKPEHVSHARVSALELLAESVGFEPTVTRRATTAFEAAPFVRSGNSPGRTLLAAPARGRRRWRSAGPGRRLGRVRPVDEEQAMAEALAEARAAGEHGDVPIGAVVLVDGEIVGRGRNERERLGDPTAHAEVQALRDAARALGRWRLDDATVVATLEPCPMCAGALVNARVARVVFGAADPKAGAMGTLYNLGADPRLNHELAVVAGVRAGEAAELLTAFFADRR